MDFSQHMPSNLRDFEKNCIGYVELDLFYFCEESLEKEK